MNKKNLNMMQLKTIGFACIFLLNLAWCGLVHNDILQLLFGTLGSAGITLFIFSMNEALKHTANISKYMLRVLLLAVISAVPYYFIYHDFTSEKLQLGSYLSSPFTIFFCIGSLVLYDRISQKKIRMVSVVFFCLVSWFFGVEWAPFAVILAYFIHIYDDKPNYRDYNIIMFFLVIAVVSFVFLFTNGAEKGELLKNISLLGVVAAVPLIRRYNGEKGTLPRLEKLSKWLFYIAYPAMLLLLLMIKLILSYK